MSRSPNFEYYPGPVPTAPEAMTEYLANELYQISLALRPDPTYMQVQQTGDFTIGPTENWQTLCIGESPAFATPASSWNAATGEWTIGETGLYELNANLFVSAFGLGNKDYYLGLRPVFDGVPGLERLASGDDAFPLSVEINQLLPLDSGEVLRMEGTAVHENQTGTITGAAYWYLRRVE